MYIKTNDPDFVRDEHSTALINTNVQAYKQYKIARANKQQIGSYKQEIDDLKSQVKNLTELVNRLIEGKHD